MNRDELVAVALGERPADLIVSNGQLVNVWSGEIYPADIAVAGNRIALVGDVSHALGPETMHVNAEGRYLVPGLIDCHIHVGASSLTMTELARLVVPSGTAALVTDFTEAGKMRGTSALRFFLDESKQTPLQVFLSPFHTNLRGIPGLRAVTWEEMLDVFQWPECIELREWNVYAQRTPGLRDLADAAREAGLRLCGHLEGQSGRLLQASAAAGASSDHEATSAGQVLERVRLGLAVQMRYSSAADDMTPALKAVTQYRLDTRALMFSTDEEDIDDIADKGHIDHRVRTAIAMGVAPIDAIRMGSLNAAVHLGQTGDLGSLTPGRLAFINLVDDLATFRVSKVIYGSEIVAEDGHYRASLPKPEIPSDYYHTIHLARELQPQDFAVPARGSDAIDINLIDVAPLQVYTELAPLTMHPEDQALSADPAKDVAKIAVVERHLGSGKIGKAFIRGFGLKRGAFGSSYHPGPLNIGVVGTNDRDLAVVANRIAELGGGFVAALDGEVIAEVPLPVLGFLSEASAEEVADGFRAVKRAIGERLGSDFPGIFTALAYVCMPGVLPHVRMSADGLVRVEHHDAELITEPLALEQG